MREKTSEQCPSSPAVSTVDSCPMIIHIIESYPAPLPDPTTPCLHRFLNRSAGANQAGPDQLADGPESGISSDSSIQIYIYLV